MKSSKNILVSGAVLGAILGSLAVALYPRREEVLDKIKDCTSEITDKVLSENGMFSRRKKNQSKAASLACGFLGLLAGASSALFLTPRTGKQLLKDVSKTIKKVAISPETQRKKFKANYQNSYKVKTPKKRKPRIRTRK